jgi:hypothetical protein
MIWSGEVTPLPVELMMGPVRSKIINRFQWRESNYFLVPLFICPGLHMLFVDLNYNFSCQEFDRLLCNCSVEDCRENTMRKTVYYTLVVTLPATGVDKTDNLLLPIGITETLHMPNYWISIKDS